MAADETPGRTERLARDRRAGVASLRRRSREKGERTAIVCSSEPAPSFLGLNSAQLFSKSQCTTSQIEGLKVVTRSAGVLWVRPYIQPPYKSS
jgi:hypothetical protein